MANFGRVKTWGSEVLQPSDLNAEFDNIINNITSGGVDADNIDLTDVYAWSGAHTHTSTLTVGVDDAGHDVKFFGATTGKSWLWDESADTEIVTGNSTISGTLGVTGVLTATAQSVHTGGIQSGGNVVSDTDSTDDLGTTSVRWANLYVDSIGDSGQGLGVDSSSVRMANIPSITVCAANGGVANVTGDGTAYTVVFGTEIIDQGADFSSTTFTAPVAGQYAVSGQVLVDGIGSSHTFASLQIVTSNRTYYQQFNPYGYESGTATPIPFSVITDMDASDTLHLSLVVSGGTKTISINNTSSTNVRTYLSVQMIA